MKWLPQMAPRDPLESNVKIRRRRRWDIFFGSSFPLLIGLAFLWNNVSAADGGSAIGGRIVNGKFLVYHDIGVFSPVSGLEWFFNLAVSCLALASALLAIGGMTYFAVRYFFLPTIKARANRNPLDR